MVGLGQVVCKLELATVKNYIWTNGGCVDLVCIPWLRLFGGCYVGVMWELGSDHFTESGIINFDKFQAF